MEFKSDINFGDKFYSLDITTNPPRIVEWEVEKITFCNYSRDEYGNLGPLYNKPCIEYGLKRYDGSIRKEFRGILGIEIKAFKTKEELMEFLSQ